MTNGPWVIELSERAWGELDEDEQSVFDEATVREQEKARARQQVKEALRRSAIKKPSVCTRCKGSGARLEAHHGDYSKPLEVEWLCVLCHKEEHRIERSRKLTGVPRLHKGAASQKHLFRRAARRVSHNVRFLREQQAITQVELAQRLGCSARMIQKIEGAEDVNLTLRLLSGLAESLGVDLAVLFATES